MDNEITTPSQSLKSNNSLDKIHILVVDDDTTCLTIVAEILKRWNCQVFTVKHPDDALCTLRRMKDVIDLVVTDIHMPGMNGFELKKHIDEEFKLPVAIISGDDRESVLLRSLHGGAVFFIAKPIKPNDLQGMWEYVVTRKKQQANAMAETARVQWETSLATRSLTNELGMSDSSLMEGRCSKKTYYKKKGTKKAIEGTEERKDGSATPVKKKFVWTTELHALFIEAIINLGFESAVPTRILAYMDDPRLTRENIASHLQKYRLFLKRCEEALGPTKNLTTEAERVLRSSFASGITSMILNSQLQNKLPQVMKQQLLGSPAFQPNSKVNRPPVGNAPSTGRECFPNQVASSSNPMAQFGSLANVKNAYNIPMDISLGGGISMTGANGDPSNFNSSTYGVGGPSNSIRVGNGNLESFNTTLQLSAGFNYSKKNYAGYEITGDGKLLLSGKKVALCTGNEATNGDSNRSNGLANEQGNNGSFGGPVGYDNASPFLPANILQQEIPFMQSPPPPPLLKQQEITVANNTSTFGCVSPLRPFGKDELNYNFLQQMNDSPSPDQQQDRRLLFSPDFDITSLHIEENPHRILQNHDKPEGGEKGMGNGFNANLPYEGYTPMFDQYPNQIVDGGFMNSELYSTHLEGAPGAEFMGSFFDNNGA